MYPFWDSVIAPMLRVSGAQRLIEIGALRGETTVKMLDDLGPESEVHVIDPVPAFDPGEHEARFPGRYVFHRDLSLNALPGLDAFDAALIDGDHNWYSVYNECRLLAEAADRQGRPAPLMILHDVGWPYGRRDLYYDPSNIPEEHRQPFQYKGMRPGRSQLLPGGGMNITLANAETEGGERNGVMTGLEDWMEEYPHPLRMVHIPIYFGLAIVADHRMLAEQPELAAFLDRLETHEGTKELLDLSEAIRLDAVVFEHNVDRMNRARLQRAIDRQIELLRTTSGVDDTEASAIDELVASIVAGTVSIEDIPQPSSEAGRQYLDGSLAAYEIDAPATSP